MSKPVVAAAASVALFVVGAASAQTPVPAPAAEPAAAAAPASAPYPPIDRARALLCYAHATRDIRNSARSGRVPGPAWQVQDFWSEQLGDDEDPRAEGERQAQAIDARAAADPDGVEREGVACAHQALDAAEADSD